MWQGELDVWPAPRLVALVGGTVSRRIWQRPLAPELTTDTERELVLSALRAVSDVGGSLLIAPSRRTPEVVRNAIDATLQGRTSTRGSKDGLTRPDLPLAVHYGPEVAPNPYLGLLACADYVLATADSINMVSEACGTAKPVYVARPRECARRFLAFHERLLATSRTREWQGALDPLDEWSSAARWGTHQASDAERAAARIRAMLVQRGIFTG